MKCIGRLVLASISFILFGCRQLAPFVPTPMPVVERMLELAKVIKNDVVYDLGSGDGRIVITAATKYGARGVGVEIDPELVREARKNVLLAKVDHLVEIRQQDILAADLSDATVVMIYLGPSSNSRLRPILQSQLRPGTRLVSHEYDMEDWEPERADEVMNAGTTYVIYLWRISR